MTRLYAKTKADLVLVRSDTSVSSPLLPFSQVSRKRNLRSLMSSVEYETPSAHLRTPKQTEISFHAGFIEPMLCSPVKELAEGGNRCQARSCLKTAPC